jgi:hypothetical protein
VILSFDVDVKVKNNEVTLEDIVLLVTIIKQNIEEGKWSDLPWILEVHVISKEDL